MSIVKYKETIREGNIPQCGNFSGCCGSSYREDTSSPARKWKNQFGEGITPAKMGHPVNMITHNTRGILLAPGKITAPETNGFEVTTVKTKNGPITISVRTVW